MSLDKQLSAEILHLGAVSAPELALQARQKLAQSARDTAYDPMAQTRPQPKLPRCQSMLGSVSAMLLPPCRPAARRAAMLRTAPLLHALLIALCISAQVQRGDAGTCRQARARPPWSCCCLRRPSRGKPVARGQIASLLEMMAWRRMGWFDASGPQA